MEKVAQITRSSVLVLQPIQKLLVQVVEVRDAVEDGGEVVRGHDGLGRAQGCLQGLHVLHESKKKLKKKLLLKIKIILLFFFNTVVSQG